MITDIVFVRTGTPCVEAVDLMLKHDVEVSLSLIKRMLWSA